MVIADKLRVQSSLLDLHPICAQQAVKILEACALAGLSVGIFETVRSAERQKYLKSTGKSKTLQSYHLLGLAVDFVFLTEQGNFTWNRPKQDWDKLAEIIERHGFYSLWRNHGWDGPHGEIRFDGVPTKQLYSWYIEVNGNLTEFYKKIDHLMLEKFPEYLVKLEPVTIAETDKIIREVNDIFLNPEPAPAKPWYQRFLFFRRN